MRLFFICPSELTKFKGAPKGFIEIYEAVQRRGVDCRIFAPSDLGSPHDFETMPWDRKHREFPIYLRQFMEKNRNDFDAIEFEHFFLPYPANEVVPDKVKISRCSILTHQLMHYNLPHFGGLRPLLGRIVNGARRKRELLARLDYADRTIRNCDLVNVPNEYDKQRLISEGIPEENIAVVPYGLTEERLQQLADVSLGSVENPVITFVGTYDERKGGVEMPQIFRRILDAIPGARFRLLGTRGLFQTAGQVYSKFPASMHARIEVVPTFNPDSILDHLAGSTVGIFPSHLESFGFGVLEMLGAGIPVVAYDVPGPPVMLREDMLVGKGDWQALADKVIQWLRNPELLKADSDWSEKRARDFHYDIVADKTIAAYQGAVDRKRAKLAAL